MAKTKSFKLDSSRDQKLDMICDATGMTASQVLRHLIDRAEVVSKPVICLRPEKYESAEQVLADAGAFAQ